MENRPPQQEPPRRPPPNSARKTNGSSGGSPTPPWLWLLLLVGFGLIFYQFVPKTETSVRYYPWFYDQVQADNIKSISIQTPEIRGELRKEQPYQSSPQSAGGPGETVCHQRSFRSLDRLDRAEIDPDQREEDARRKNRPASWS